jgi:hypothetical protein
MIAIHEAEPDGVPVVWRSPPPGGAPTRWLQR